MVPQIDAHGWPLLAVGNRILQAFPTRWLLVTTDAYGMRTIVAGTNGQTNLPALKGLKSFPQPWETNGG